MLLARSLTLIRPNLIRNQIPFPKHVSILSYFDRFKLSNSKNVNKVKLNVLGVHIYEQIADKVDYASFFLKYNLPNTYNSWFLVTELHVWMALARIMVMEENGRVIRSSIVETLWQDATTRAKQLQADNPSAMRKQLNILSQQFQAALITYDDGMAHDDKSLATSLWVRLFDKKCNNYEHLLELVEYVRRQLVMLDNIREEEMMEKPVIKWEKITGIPGMSTKSSVASETTT